MALQKQVGLYYAPAVPGDRATQNPVIYTQGNPRAEGDITIGHFVFAGTDPFRQVKASTTGKDAPVGFVERILAYYNYNLISPGAMDIPDQTDVTVAVRGDFWCAPSNQNVAIDQAVFASTTDGSIQTADAKATLDGYVKTSWTVKYYDADSNLAIISNWQTA
ncbi:structural cement protein Gp24 [Xenorhabdus bharatensis]|uniref:structural cement protein Gp24 n=1 Tax=Xenorhabdus bharatensis TaxID=3136256 RepID=UPI0030F466A3